MLEVRLLGRFDIRCDGKTVLISSRAAQSLFAYLILTAGTSHRREKLAGMFWPDTTEEKARAYLRHELWRIRKALSPKSNSDYFLADDINISFNPSAEYWLDVNILTNVSERPSIADLMNALAVFQVELLPDFYDEWIILERDHLQAAYEQKMARLLELLNGEKRWQDILEWAERWISLGGAPEAAFRYLMIAYDALGDRAKVASTYERCAQALRVLDLEPSEQTRALACNRTTKLNIPIPLTSFIGREKELKEVADLLSKSRLVTLTGSGGVGKTRLAIQVVAEVLSQFPDGVWFLDLAPLNDPALVPHTLAKVLGLRESGELPLTDILITYFRSRTALVIFDNCEHLIESCAHLINSLMYSCERLSILATSREALRLSGELCYRVPSLETPGRNIQYELDNIVKIESVQLFIERAVLVAPSFAMRSQNALIIAQICQRLDGIPLAIELAAARTNMLTVEQISKRLDDRFKLLTIGLRSALPRHQTLRAMIEWSYDLLSDKERLLFKRLAVFSGGWMLEATEEVCSGNGIESTEVLDLLSKLVNKSLVLVETVSGEFRYRRLETIRQFAREKFLEYSESVLLRDRHLIYFLEKAEEIEPYLMGTEQSVWMDYLDLELDNFRLALEWSIQNNKGEESLRLFSALGWFWFIRCHFTEGEEWFKKIIDLRTTVSKSTQAKTLGWAAWLYMAKGDDPASTSFLQESLILYRELGDMKGVSTTLQLLGVNEFRGGLLVKARSYFEESLSISRQVNNKAAMPRVLIHLGQFSEIEGNFSAAWRYYEEALELCHEIGEGHLTHVVLCTMGYFAFSQKDNLKAREYYEEALKICIKLKNKRTIGDTLLSLTDILSAENRYSESAQLQGFATTLFDESESLTESRMAEIKRSADISKKHLGEHSYRKEFDIGKTLKLEQAVEIALKQ
jgi:predicted ATPase/DNA-binding SARP family transcriptional activator